MTPLSHLCAPVSVPYRHTVSAVASVASVNLDLNAPRNQFERGRETTKPTHQIPRGNYCANSAAPGFAAHILVEAGLAGSDPFAGARGTLAYNTRRQPISTLRLVA